MSGGQDRSEKPTEKKLREARERGQIPKSRELNSAAVLLGGGMVLYLSNGVIFDQFGQMLRELWSQGFSSTLTLPSIKESMGHVLIHFFTMIAPTVISILLIAVGINIIQTRGLNFSLKAVQPKFSKLNPFQGLKQIFSIRSLIELVKSILKIMIVGWVVYSVFRDGEDLFLPMVQQELPQILEVFGHLSLKLLVRVSLIMIVLGIADYCYQAWQHRKDLMMTKQEVKEEHKQSEGNPQIKSRIRSIQRALARQRMMAKVPKATAIVVNPTHYAVALQYKQQMEAPKVVAKGVDFVARKIIEVGRKHGVPVIQNPPLARALYQEVKLEGTIPISLYRAVAKVLAYVYQQKQTRTK